MPSARSARIPINRSMRAAVRLHASRVHSRMSVATWSLRLRPVWSLPPTSPTSSTSALSTFMWTSSRSSLQAIFPARMVSRTFSRPARIARASSSETTPTFASMVTWAREPSMSCSASRWSTSTLAL